MKARRRRVGWSASLVTVLFFVLLVGVATFSYMVFNLWLNSIFLPKNSDLDSTDKIESLWNYEYLANTLATIVLCIVLIILDFAFMEGFKSL